MTFNYSKVNNEKTELYGVYHYSLPFFHGDQLVIFVVELGL